MNRTFVSEFGEHRQCRGLEGGIIGNSQIDAALTGLTRDELGKGIAETVSTPLLVLDDTMHVLFANPAYCTMYLLSEEDLRGRVLFEIGDGQWDDPALRDLLERLLPEKTEIRDLHIRAKLKDLGMRALLVNARQVRLEDVARDLILLSLADVTDKENLERDVGFYMDRLERSNRDLEEFAHAAAHDLQEPLRKIQTYADRLSSGLAELIGEDERRYLERMQSAVERLRRRIDDMLKLSRVSRSEPSLQPVEMNELVRGVVDQLDASVEASDARIHIEDLPTIQGDSSLLQLVLQNLVSNAIKFRKAGARPSVRIYLEGSATSDDPDARIRIVVEDDGIGFDAQYAERIFRPFERLHGAREYEGTGMGLAISRRIMEHHDGWISAEPRPEGGSRFVLVFPSEPTQIRIREPQ